MVKPNLAFLVSKNGNITLVIDGKSHMVNTDHVNYHNIREAINDHIAGKYNSVQDWFVMVDVPKTFEKFTGSIVTFKDGKFWYCGQELHNGIITRIEQLLAQRFDAQPLINFLNNVMANSSRRVVETIFQFIDSKYIPITPDGCFFAYKSVQNDYLDWYSSSISNHVGGEIPRLERNLVDDNFNLSCSFGYHVGTYEYASTFHNGENERIMMVKVNPKDVVSVPSDASQGKVRVCWYEVVSEMTDKKTPYEAAVVNNDLQTYGGPLDNDTPDDDFQGDDLMDDESDEYDEDSYEESYDSYDTDSYEDEDSYDEDAEEEELPCGDENCGICYEQPIVSPPAVPLIYQPARQRNTNGRFVKGNNVSQTQKRDSNGRFI